MTRIDLQIHDDVLTTINKIKDIKDSGLELAVPEGSVLFENILNLKLLEEFAEKNQMSLQFTTNDENGSVLLEMLKENSGSSGAFMSDDIKNEDLEQGGRIKPESKLQFPKFEFSLPTIPVKKGVLFGVVGALVLAGAGFFILRSPKATANIIVSAQPLTRSVTIKVTSAGVTSADAKTLRGTNLTTTAEDTDVIATTGTKTIGTYAKGPVTIYNNTDADIKIKKGTTINYEDDNSKTFTYTTDAEVTVSAMTTDNSTTPITLTPGETDVDITATIVGSDYNIDSDKTLSVKGYKSSQIIAKTTDKIKGGKKSDVKVVAVIDQTTLLQNVTDKTKADAAKNLQSKIGATQKLVDGSIDETVTKSTYSNVVGDQADNLNLTLDVDAQGLAYNPSDLNALLDQLVVGLVPEGYKLSDKDRETNVQVLGKSSRSVLSSTEADIQVTLKAFIVPDINVDDLKNQLKGKNVTDAQKILGSIKNIKTYDFKITPSLPLLKRVPGDSNRIIINITNE